MRILTAIADSGRSISINCDQVLYASEHQDPGKCVVVMAAGDLLVVQASYLEVVGFLKSND